jgi:hypothetical protein
MANSSTQSMTETQTYRRRTVMGALATGGGFAALGGTALQEDDDEDGDTPTADRTVDLVCRESETVTFWAVDTTDLDAGEHEHGIVTADGSATGTLTVEETGKQGASPDEYQGGSEDNSESSSGEDTDESSQNGSESESGGDSQDTSEEDSQDTTDEDSDDDSDAESDESSGGQPAEFTVSGVSSLVGTEQGDNLDVSATVENVGGGDGTQTVECRVAGETVDERTVSLDGGESTSSTFAGIATADIDPGEYEFGVFSEDDSSTGTLSISQPPEEEPSEFVVVDMTPRNHTVTEGELFDLSATIENTGGTTGTNFVEMEASIASDAHEVEIAPGESTTVSFTDIDTGGFPTGDHLLAIYTPHDGMTGTLTIEAADQDSGGDSDGNSTDGAEN